MRYIRDSYERVTRRYTLNIDEEYIEALNNTLKGMYGETNPPVIIEAMVALVAKNEEVWEEYPELNFILEHRWYGDYNVGDFIRDCLDEDIWDTTDVDIIEGETDDTEDSFEFDYPAEQRRYDLYVSGGEQMSIFDNKQEEADHD